jgi:hypothetical protein
VSNDNITFIYKAAMLVMHSYINSFMNKCKSHGPAISNDLLHRNCNKKFLRSNCT